MHRETVSRHVRLAAGISKPAILPAGPGADGMLRLQLARERPFKTGQSARRGYAPPALVSPTRRSYCDRLRETIEAKRGGRSHRPANLPGPGCRARLRSQLLDGAALCPAAGSKCSRCRFGGWNAARAKKRRSTSAWGRRSSLRTTLDGARKRRKTHVLRIVLSHSRKAYSEAVDRQTTDNFIRCLENAFAHFGGVPQTLVIDNLKAAVTQADWYDPELNPKLRAFAAHYGVAILPTRPRTPRHKGKIERGVGYVQSNALQGSHVRESRRAERTPPVTGRRTSPTAASTARHASRSGIVFREIEQPALRPLPAERFPLFHEAQRIVHRDGHVSVERAYYSVPVEYLTRSVWVRWDARLVRIFNHRFEQIAVHAKQPPGKFSTHASHIATEKINGIERGAAWLLQKAGHIGPHAEEWAAAMLERRGVEGLRVLQGLSALAGKHGTAAIDAACEVAAQLRRLSPPDRSRTREAAGAQQVEFEFLSEHPLIRDLADYGAVAHRAMERTVLAGYGGRNQQDPIHQRLRRRCRLPPNPHPPSPLLCSVKTLSPRRP